MKEALEQVAASVPVATLHAPQDELSEPRVARPSERVVAPAAQSSKPMAAGGSRLQAWTASAAGLVIATVLLWAIAPELIAPYAPTQMDGSAILLAPSSRHWLGTDQFGRDVGSLVVYGARQSVLMAIFAVLISCSCGVALGLVAGYTGGACDMLLMRAVDVWMAIPNILLAIAICTALDPSLHTTILAVSVTAIPRYARVLRAQVMAIRARPFILAARASGASHASILRRHVLPHCSSTILVLATLGVGSAILLGSSLSFLGLGINDERPDWGYLLTQGRGYLTVAWWTVTFPGLAITLLVIAVNTLGDALRRRLEPRGAAGTR